ncbi:hypothetical protein BOO69_12605 [Sulfitobacter alexandrii]|uniref:Uncharacterized protein n=1 Tax=Sulfitobacter alexandrii TaxID=1917485 RepID=A0A1J0WIL0_9RHOB|nr:hypothetical protein [Sulfitobacter alexandrii]APE44147.1 hypothetical protein BOO69_12605 [Sulfitobacter alexandrii]
MTFHRDTELFDPEPAGGAEQTAPQSDPDTTRHAGVEDGPAAGHDGQAATLSAKIAALETAIGNIPENWEPDGAVEDDYSGTDAPAMAWEDDSESAATTARLHNLPRNHRREADAASFFREREEPEAARAPETESKTEEDRFAFSDEDQLLDEEALRDLVSEIVRAELQGALGERITRNVRKLVRREIHRALTAQELE